MAYNGRYSGNPDALPAHAEPEQAAAMLQNRPSSYGAPPPAPAQNVRHDDRYSRPAPPAPYQAPNPAQSYQASNPAQSYQASNPAQSYQASNPAQSYHDGRQPASRYDNYPPPQQPDRHGSQAQQPPIQHRYSNPAPPPQQPARNPYASPPPQTQGPPGPGYHHNRPPIAAAQRPPTVAPPQANSRDALWPLFLAVDKDRTGQLSEASLRSALVNGDYTAFDPHTVRMMIRLFDTDRSNTINFDEFCGLWGFLAAWRDLFDRFDKDRSASINLTEFSDALIAFGYRLSPQFVQLLFSTYARTTSGRGDGGGREKGLSFDLFVQACISLKRMTDVFKKYDHERSGFITLSFEEFLTGGQSLFLFNSISPETDTGLY